MDVDFSTSFSIQVNYLHSHGLAHTELRLENVHISPVDRHIKVSPIFLFSTRFQVVNSPYICATCLLRIPWPWNIRIWIYANCKFITNRNNRMSCLTYNMISNRIWFTQVGILGNTADFYEDSPNGGTMDANMDRRQMMIAFDMRYSLEITKRYLRNVPWNVYLIWMFSLLHPCFTDVLDSWWQKWCCRNSWTPQYSQNSSHFSQRYWKPSFMFSLSLLIIWFQGLEANILC